MKNLNVNSVTIEYPNPKMFKTFFEIDSDFGDNGYYFRPDTLEVGYENEAERVSEELYEKYFKQFDGSMVQLDYIETLHTALEEGANMSVDGAECSTQFILGNSTYVTDYEFSIICSDWSRTEYTVVISYLSH